MSLVIRTGAAVIPAKAGIQVVEGLLSV